MNNIGDPVHRQVIDTGILPILVKIVKKKVHISLKCGSELFLHTYIHIYIYTVYIYIYIFTCLFYIFSFWLAIFYFIFTVWPTCTWENISTVRCCANIRRRTYRKISSILFCLLWISGTHPICWVYSYSIQSFFS